MIKNRDYSSLDQLLNIKEFSSLHLYMFLLGWTHVRSINDAIVLQDSMSALVTDGAQSDEDREEPHSHFSRIKMKRQKNAGNYFKVTWSSSDGCIKFDGK